MKITSNRPQRNQSSCLNITYTSKTTYSKDKYRSSKNKAFKTKGKEQYRAKHKDIRIYLVVRPSLKYLPTSILELEKPRLGVSHSVLMLLRSVKVIDRGFHYVDVGYNRSTVVYNLLDSTLIE